MTRNRKVRQWSFVAVVCLLLLGGAFLWKEGVIYPGTAFVSEDDAFIYEALFRYIFEHNGSAAQQRAKTYFLLIGERNPPRSFLQRFADQNPPVEKGWKYRRGRGLLFRVGEIKYIDADAVEIYGGYDEGNMSAGGYRYKLSKKQGKWMVVEEENIWIS